MSSPTVDTFGAKVEEYRGRLGMLQKTLAEKVGLSPSHVNRIEKGFRGPPQVEAVLSMVEALRLTRAEAEAFVQLAGYSPIVLQEDERPMPVELADKTSLPAYPQAIRSAVHSAQSVQFLTEDTTGGRIEKLIAAARLSEEEEGRISIALVEITRQLLALIQTQREQ